MHLEKIQTREQAVEFAARIAARFFSADDDSRWSGESNRLPEHVRRECCLALSQIQHWQNYHTLVIEVAIIVSMLELIEFTEKYDETEVAMVLVVIATCGCVYETNWRQWVADVSESAMCYFSEKYGPGSCGGMENCYQIRELAELLQLPLSKVADEFDDVEDIEEELNEEDDL